MQLKTGIWVDALIRRAQAGGAFACVATRGDVDAGSVLVVVRGGDGLCLYAPERDMDGARVWRAEVLGEADCAARIAQRLDFDPDLTVVEIDDRAARHFIEEPVLGEAPPAGGADAAAAARALFRDR